MKKFPRFIQLSLLLGSTLPQLHAASGTWTNTTSGGLWSDGGNWSGGTIADGAGFNANFNTLDITADNIVHLDSARTISSLTFGDADTSSAAGWILDNNGVGANVLTLGSSPNITVNALETGKNATISAILAGTVGLIKGGVGTLVLSGANTLSGPVNVNGGTLEVTTGGTLAAGAGAGQIYIGNGGLPGASMVVSGGTVSSSAGFFVLGNNGAGNYTQTAGSFSHTNSSGFYMGNNAGGASIVDISGGTFTDSATAFLGTRANTTLTISGTADVKFAALSFGAATAATTVTNLNGGTLTLTTGGMTVVNGTHTVNLNGGTLKADSASGFAWNNLAGVTAVVGTNGVTLDSGSNSMSITQALTGATSGTVNKIGTGTLTLAGASSYTGSTTVTNGTIVINGSISGSSPVVVNSGAALSLKGNNATGNGGALGTYTINGGIISNDGAAGITQVINGALTLNGGTLAATSTFNTTFGNFYLSSSGHPVNVTGTTASTISAVLALAGNHTFNVADTTAGVDLLVSGRLLSNQGILSGAIIKTGAGTLNLSNSLNDSDTGGVLAFTGVTLNAGQVIFASGSLGNGRSFGGGAFAAKARFTGNSTLTWDAGNTDDISALVTPPGGTRGGMKIEDGVTATLDTGANNVTLGTAIEVGTLKTGAITKTGSGRLTLGAANTYTGATIIKAGTLALSGSGSIDSSSITVGDAGSSGAAIDVTTISGGTYSFGTGQTIGGIGTINASGKNLTVAGSIAPGNSAGLLSVSTNTLQLASSSALNIEMTRGVTPGAGANYDQLGLTGTLDIVAGSTLNLAALGAGSWTMGDIYFLIANDSNDAIIGAFNGFAEGSTVTFDSQMFGVTYQADSGTGLFNGGNDFALRVVPEPRAALLGVLGVLVLLRRRDRSSGRHS